MTYKNAYIFLLCVTLLAILSFCFFYFFSSIKSEVIISDQISEFIDQVDRTKVALKKKLIVIDIDDTLLESKSILGTPTWFYNMVNKIRHAGASKSEAYEIMGKIDKIVQEQIEVQPIEDALIAAIKSWQKQKSLVIAITSRSNEFAEVTKKQLSNLSLDFYSSLFFCVEQNWSDTHGKFNNGTLYVEEGHTKGELFETFFNILTNTCGVAVNLIAQADDQERYIKQINAIAEDNNINYIGIIYGKALSKRVFNLSLANRELNLLQETIKAQIIPKKFETIFNVY